MSSDAWQASRAGRVGAHGGGNPRPMTGRIGAFRFCRDVEATSCLFQDLGFVELLRSERGGFVVLRGASGEVQLHSAATAERPRRPGETELYLSVPDLDALVASLADPALLSVSDEAWGRVALVQHARARGVWIDEEQRDLYGYRLAPVGAEPTAQLTMVCATPDPGADAEVLAELTLQVSPGSVDDDVSATWGAGSGVVELHRASRLEAPEPLVCVTTPEPLRDLSRRLEAAGWQVVPGAVSETDDADGRGAMAVRDPDGALVEIRQGDARASIAKPSTTTSSTTTDREEHR